MSEKFPRVPRSSRPRIGDPITSLRDPRNLMGNMPRAPKLERINPHENPGIAQEQSQAALEDKVTLLGFDQQEREFLCELSKVELQIEQHKNAVADADRSRRLREIKPEAQLIRPPEPKVLGKLNDEKTNLEAQLATVRSAREHWKAKYGFK